jgi:hypothetical protein
MSYENRKLEKMPAKTTVQQIVVLQKREAFGRPILVAELQVYDHEGFREDDYVAVTVEKATA